MSLLPGAGPQRFDRASPLIFGWDAKYRSVAAYTGQNDGFQVVSATVPGNVDGQNGLSILSGRGMPRWVQAPARGNRLQLAIESSVALQDQEVVPYGYNRKVMQLSIFWRVWPMWAAGTNLGLSAWGLLLGNGTTNGGLFAIGRVNDTWQVQRKRGAVAISTSFVEPGATAYPIDILATLGVGGLITLSTRDALGVLRNGTTTPADPNMLILTETWAGSLLTYSPVGIGAYPGGRWWYEKVKIAKGVLTFTQMDLLT